MAPTADPWSVFFDCWDRATHHLHRIAPVISPEEARSPAHRAMDEACRRVRRYLRDVLRWPEEERERVVAAFALEWIIWSQVDGVDRESLRVRLRRTQAKVRAAVALGAEAWDGPPAVAASGEVRAVTLPPSFYLPRDAGETEVRDSLPWPDAAEYVSDGARLGIRLRGGAVQWFESLAPGTLSTLRAGSRSRDAVPVVDGLKEYIIRQPTFPLPLAREIARLEARLCAVAD